MIQPVKYHLSVPFAEKKFSCLSNNESTVLGLKHALSNKFGVPVSHLKLTILHQNINWELSDDSYMWSLGIQEGDTIYVEMILTPAKKTQAKAMKFMQERGSDRLVMFKRSMPADHSCFFTSIAYAMENKNHDAARYLREVVAAHIASEPNKYNESILEMSNEDYQKWILCDLNWGGALEAEILSRYYGVEICVINTFTQKPITFGSRFNFEERIYLLYNGTHYDLIVRNISQDMDPMKDVTIFKCKDVYAFNGAIMVGLQMSHQDNYSFEKDEEKEEDLDGRQGRLFDDKKDENHVQKKLVQVKCQKQGKFSKLKRFLKKIIFH